MKIAVCMSGHFRFADYTSRQNKWFYDLLKSEYNADIFLHTWSDKKQVILTDHLYKFTNTHLDKNVPSTPHWWGQWISLSRCLDLVNSYNKDYDVVIRVRPDNLIFPFNTEFKGLMKKVVNDNTILTDAIWGKNEVLHIQDQLFMTKYSTFNHMFNKENIMSVLEQSKKNNKIRSVSIVGFLLQSIPYTEDNIVKAFTYTDYFKQRLCRPPHLNFKHEELNHALASKIYNDYRQQRQILKDNSPTNTYEDWI